jgi:hypothetical protein
MVPRSRGNDRRASRLADGTARPESGNRNDVTTHPLDRDPTSATDPAPHFSDGAAIDDAGVAPRPRSLQ